MKRMAVIRKRMPKDTCLRSLRHHTSWSRTLRDATKGGRTELFCSETHPERVGCSDTRAERLQKQRSLRSHPIGPPHRLLYRCSRRCHRSFVCHCRGEFLLQLQLHLPLPLPWHFGLSFPKGIRVSRCCYRSSRNCSFSLLSIRLCEANDHRFANCRCSYRCRIPSSPRPSELWRPVTPLSKW